MRSYKDDNQLTSITPESESSLSGSAVLILGPRTWKEATKSCLELGETLWKSDSGFELIQSDLDYLVYLGSYSPKQQFWTASHNQKSSTINADGQINHASPTEETACDMHTDRSIFQQHIPGYR